MHMVGTITVGYMLCREGGCTGSECNASREMPGDRTLDELRFGRFGMTQELINGRAAMLGSIAALAAEINTGAPMCAQVSLKLAVLTPSQQKTSRN